MTSIALSLSRSFFASLSSFSFCKAFRRSYTSLSSYWRACFSSLSILFLTSLSCRSRSAFAARVLAFSASFFLLSASISACARSRIIWSIFLALSRSAFYSFAYSESCLWRVSLTSCLFFASSSFSFFYCSRYLIYWYFGSSPHMSCEISLGALIYLTESVSASHSSLVTSGWLELNLYIFGVESYCLTKSDSITFEKFLFRLALVGILAFEIWLLWGICRLFLPSWLLLRI